MKRLLVIAAALVLCIIAAIMASQHSMCRFAGPSMTYATRAEASEVVARGWLPDFLPSSVSNIHVKIHYSHNQVLCAFSFSPEEDITGLLGLAVRLPEGQFRSVRPSAICRRDPWLPKAVIRGRLDKLAPEGFELYGITLQPDQDREINMWYFLLNPRAGMGYLWCGFDRE